MKKLTFIFICCLIVSSSCKKNRVCECKNANGTYDAGEIDATRYQGKKYCSDLSVGDTKCYLK
jgi:hypothetical protein